MIDNFKEKENKRPQETVNAIIAEYNVLRKEMDGYHNHQKQIMNFALIVLTAIFTVLGSGIAFNLEALKSAAFIYLLFPFVFTLLEMIYLDRTIRILRIADYIHNCLKKKINELTIKEVWQWEKYKRKTKIFSRKFSLFLDRIRWLIFILSSMVSVGIFFFLECNPIKYYYIILFVFDAFAIIMSIVIIFIAEETTGIKDIEDYSLDES